MLARPGLPRLGIASPRYCLKHWRTTLHYKHNIKNSVSFALASFEEMKRNAVPYNPVNFSVWYNYHAQANPKLISRMNELLGIHDRIDDEQSAALFDEFVSGEILSESRRISEQLAIIANEITDNLEQTDKASGEYVGQMETLQKHLSSAGSSDAVDNVVDRILAASRNATAEIRALRESARTNQEQTDALRQELESVRDESRTDPLTGIANRRQFDERLQQLCDMSPRNKEPFSLVLGDIDYFKKINDQYGHQAGDQVLCLLGERFRQNVKGKDLAARYGGEEFALLLPNTPLSAAISFADTLRKLICENKINLEGNEQTITMSFGVAQFDFQETPKSLIGRADENLYRSKEAGRNTVSPPPNEPDDHDCEIIDVSQTIKRNK